MSYAEASGCCLGSAMMLPARSHSPLSHVGTLHTSHLSRLTPHRKIEPDHDFTLLETETPEVSFAIKYLSFQENKSTQNAQCARLQ